MPYDDSHPLPEWYRQSGARRANKPADKDGEVWQPDFADPLYMRYWGGLVTAAGARYDVVHPCAYRFGDWVDLDVLQPWDKSLLQNFPDLNPTLEAFVPRVVAFFEDYSRLAAEDLRAIEVDQRARYEALTAKGPKVVSISPADGATDVDAAIVNAITISFDRPMRDRNFALFPVPNAALPTLKGPPRFDANGSTVTLPCELKPGMTYGLQFNSPEHMAFVDTEGHPLAPFVYRFTTRK